MFETVLLLTLINAHLLSMSEILCLIETTKLEKKTATCIYSNGSDGVLKNNSKATVIIMSDVYLLSFYTCN